PTQNIFLEQRDAVAIPWFESPFFEHTFAKCDLSEEAREKVRFFADNGYLIFDPGIPHDLLDQVRASLDGKFTINPKINRSDRILDAWEFSDAVKQVAGWKGVTDMLDLIYQRKSIPFQTLNFEWGTEQRTHSDTVHFQSVPNNFMCGVWVALEA